LGCYGVKTGLTPFIDSLKDKCILFTNAHSTGPYTQASFPAILTSSYYLEYPRQKILSHKRVLISEVLTASGITTAGFHSNPYLSDYFGWNRGWDHFYDSLEDDVDEVTPYVKAREINNKVSDWLSSHKGEIRDERFFLWVHYMDVHEPYVPEKSYLDKIDESLDLNRYEMVRLFKEVLLKRDVRDEAAITTLKKLYWAHVREIDDAVRHLFGIFEDQGILANSVIILVSDHGEEFGEHGGLSHDGKMYSELINVPLMIYDPSREKGLVSDKIVSTIDIPPTIVHLFDLDTVEKYEGHSLLPLEEYPSKGAFGESLDKHGTLEKGSENEVHYYREGDLKIIYNDRDDSWELYDLKADPREQNNIINENPLSMEFKKKITPRVKRAFKS